MVNNHAVIEKDLRHIWHPCTQMKDFEQCPPIIVYQAQGSYLETCRGSLIDAQSSWWCKSLGHGHPAVLAAIKAQLDSFEHVIAANTTHPAMASLGEKLAEICGREHAFFASDGSSAVEIAMKLALQAKQIQGQTERRDFIALKNGYHGETLGTLSVSDLGLYKKPWEGFGVNCHMLEDIPLVSGPQDPLWTNAEGHWQRILPALEQLKSRVCALILEPLVQGAGGMRCYSADFLYRLAAWAKSNDIYLIADEIMTGMGRTGTWLACQHAGVEADLICLSKGLTSGTIPLSCVMIDQSIYSLFYDDYSKGKSFLHSHTHSGNSLAISAALATITAMQTESINQQAAELGLFMLEQFQAIARSCGKLSNIRSLGAMVAADMVDSGRPRTDFAFYQEALKQGALIRPLGNTLYWLPPLNTDTKTIVKLAEITLNSIHAVYQ
ncbi:adenosylmethionine--8-amino-7-oxononanoate transaminase [Legionella sp. CNM-4043-24]|uniref:adenosylmethionine--8-amino-7-oxononanoate transaminase n=1 Tax=Legionella sp. CNM-4043-24 TaxID=3421646 RepID=UPI00403B30F9